VFDPERGLRALQSHGVRYVLIGGSAANALGAPLNTNDLDICDERTPENTDGSRLRWRSSTPS